MRQVVQKEVGSDPRCGEPGCGLTGGAELRFARRGTETVLTHARVEAPLKIVRPFALDDGRLVVPLITLGPGLCGGDVCTIDVHADAGARVIVMNTAATRVLGMTDDMQATQRVRLTAGPAAHVEYYPGLTIPFPDSAFVQEIDATVAGDARLGILETWALGRVARDEYLRFRIVRSRTTVRINEMLVYADGTLLEPGTNALAGAGVLDRRRYLVSGFWLGADVKCDCRGQTPDAALHTSLIAFGQTAPGQVFLRALGDDAQALDALVRDALSRVADAWKVSPLRLERFRC